MSSAVCKVGGDYRVVGVTVNYPRRKTASLKSAVNDHVTRCAGRRRRGRGRWSSAAHSCGGQLLTAGDRRVLPTRGIAPVLGKEGVISLRSHHQQAVVWGRCGRDSAIDIAERRRTILVQSNLVI